MYVILSESQHCFVCFLPGVAPARVVADDDSDDEETVELKTFTLKQLIRQLHISSPVEHVMCLVGKKYPATSEEFYASRLPGVFFLAL